MLAASWPLTSRIRIWILKRTSRPTDKLCHPFKFMYLLDPLDPLDASGYTVIYLLDTAWSKVLVLESCHVLQDGLKVLENILSDGYFTSLTTDHWYAWYALYRKPGYRAWSSPRERNEGEPGRKNHQCTQYISDHLSTKHSVEFTATLCHPVPPCATFHLLLSSQIFLFSTFSQC